MSLSCLFYYCQFAFKVMCPLMCFNIFLYTRLWQLDIHWKNQLCISKVRCEMLLCVFLYCPLGALPTDSMLLSSCYCVSWIVTIVNILNPEWVVFKLMGPTSKIIAISFCNKHNIQQILLSMPEKALECHKYIEFILSWLYVVSTEQVCRMKIML